MDMSILARTIAVVIVVIGLAAGIIAIRDAHEGEDAVSASPSAGDDLGAELRRCRDLGMAALDDESCAAAWTRSRDNFLMREADTP